MEQNEGDSNYIILELKDGKAIRTHRNDLSAAGDYFSTLLNCDMLESREGIIRLQDITETAMKSVLEFMRSGNVKINEDNAKELFEVADYFLLPSLKKVAGNFLIHNLSPSNCISSYYLGEKYQFEELLVSSKLYIFPNFAAVAETQEFLDLESQQVEQWICSDEISVCSEDDIFKIILDWIEQNPIERKEKFEELFRHLRLTFVSRDYMRKRVMTHELVKMNSSCLGLVLDVKNRTYESQPPRRGTVANKNNNEARKFACSAIFYLILLATLITFFAIMALHHI